MSSSVSATVPNGDPAVTHWLMKAEPDTRIEKGKDVKFSIDDFEQIGTTPWDGVRNHEAKKIMKERMKLGHQILFYHSNTKVPGVYGLGEVTKEGYPDASAFDTSHPYYDPKSNPDSPTWFLVNVTYRSRLAHPVTLALLKHIATVTSPSAVHALGTGAGWFGAEELASIKSLPLINRGRLSVQPVPDAGFATIVRLGEEGGWSEEIATGKKPKATKAVKGATKKEEAADSGEAGSSTAATAPAEKEEGVAIGRGGKGLKKRAYDSGGGGDKKKVKEEDGVNVEVGAGQVAVAPDGRRKSARNK